MKVRLIDMAKRHSTLMIIITTILPVVYIVCLLAFNYQNTLALHESSMKRFQLDIEKHAKTLAYFFLERKYDVRNLADSIEVNTYFANRDMGMSEQYVNGMDVYHHIRSSDEITPILFISGNIEFLESIKELKQKDARIDHLSKPCQNKDYLNGINKLFEALFLISIQGSH